MKGLAQELRLDRKGRSALSFRATPAKARGTIKLAYGKTSGGSAPFTVPANGRVKLTIKASAKLRSRCASAAALKVKATLRIGVTTFTANADDQALQEAAKRGDASTSRTAARALLERQLARGRVPRAALRVLGPAPAQLPVAVVLGLVLPRDRPAALRPGRAHAPSWRRC